MMADDDLSPGARGALDALRSSRGACPSAEALVAYESLAEEARTEHPGHAHIQVCSRCQLTLLHMREPAEPARVAKPSTRIARWLLPLAAITVLAVALTLVDRNTGTSDATGPSNGTVRGTDLQPVAPAGAVESIREFSWQSPIRAERYRVIVRHGSTVVWQTDTTGLRAAPPPAGILQRDVQYEWQVEAIDREGTVRMTSPPQPFTFF